MPTKREIDAAAKAQWDCHRARNKSTPTPWEDLDIGLRQSYLEDTRAALTAAEKVRARSYTADT